jgi:hypothetical protein
MPHSVIPEVPSYQFVPFWNYSRSMRQYTETLEWHQFSHKPVPVNTCSIWEFILDIDDQAVPLINFYGWTGVHA